MRGGERKRCNEHTLGKKLREALKELGLAQPRLRWYECTRHTFASQWVMAGGSVQQLRGILGHSTVQVTERYAHLRPDSFGAKERARVSVDLSTPGGKVLKLAPADEVQMGSRWVQPSEAVTEKAG